MKDYYKILEVEENASDEDIKKSYRSLSKRFHPDVNPDGAEKFKEINEAYEVIGNGEKRQQYNQRKNNPYAGSDFENMFSQMFGGGGNGFRQQPRRKSSPDKIVRVQISPVESFLGTDKTINYFRDIHCNSCGGAGGEQQACHTCDGVGYQVKTFGTGFMVQQVRTVCNTCGGRGYTLVHKCYYCDGRGTKPNTHEIKINIPVGADSGQFLKLQDAGDFKNGEYGDLLIQIEVVPKDGFEKMNNDLIYSLTLDIQGIQQDKFTIPHPDGELVVQAPKIIDTSKPLRLRGKGFLDGDMYLKLILKYERPI
jgi:molecular chaperone DnaJ